MKFKEVYEILQKIKNNKVTQNDIAKAIGTSRANVSKHIAKNSFVNDEKIEKIEKYFNVKLNDNSDFITVDYYPESLIEIKNEKTVLSEKHVECKMPKNLFNINENANGYFMINSKSNSMYPIILEGDYLIIENSDNKSIEDNKIYVFTYDNNLYINRLSKNINQIIVQSENKDYPTQYIKNEKMNRFHLFGKVVYIGRSTNQL